MRVPLSVNPAVAQPMPSGPLDIPREAVPASVCDVLSCFADALSGLVGAGGAAGFDNAAGVPPAADGAAADSPAAGEAQSVPALDAPLAMPVALPATMAATVLPGIPLAMATADQGAQPARSERAPVAGPAASLAVPAGLWQRLAEGAGPSTPLPALPADSSRAAALPGAEALPLKLKTDRFSLPESGPAPTPEADAGVPAVLAAAPASEPAGTTPAPAVKLPAGTPEQWRRPLMEALGDRIRVEVGKHSEQAVIRLDPPMLGSVEIAIRHQGGVLQVQLSASHDEVVRQLQHIGDSLRQDLSQRQYTEVSVQVYAGSRDGEGRQRPDAQPEERQPGRALADADSEPAPSPFILASDRD